MSNIPQHAKICVFDKTTKISFHGKTQCNSLSLLSILNTSHCPGRQPLILKTNHLYFICTYCTGWYQSAEAWAARSGPPPWASACSGSSCPSSGIYNSFLCDNISVKKDQVLLSPRVIMSRVSSFQQLSLGMLTKVAN